jgi:hypothetical protein
MPDAAPNVGENAAPTIRGEAERVGHDESLWWADILTVLVIVGYIAGLVVAAFQ